MVSKTVENLNEILKSPCLKPKEIDLLMRLDSTEPLYANVTGEDAMNYYYLLLRSGYSTKLLVNTALPELKGRYVLEVRKKDAN